MSEIGAAMRQPSVFVRSSRRPGMCVAFVGGVHGNEFYGPAVAVALVQKIRSAPVTGKVIVVADANPPAVSERARTSRAVPGDMNRQFGPKPGPADRSLRAVADWLWRQHLDAVDVLVDIHSGGEHEMLPHARFTGDPNDVLPLVQALGLQYAMRYRSLPPGLLMSRSRRAGAVALGLEVGAGYQVVPDLLATLVNGACQLLTHVGVTDGEVLLGEEPVVVSPGSKQRASSPGVFLPRVEVGASVRRGDVVGEFTRFSGFRSRPVHAQSPGVVFSILTAGPADRGTKLVEVVDIGDRTRRA